MKRDIYAYLTSVVLFLAIAFSIFLVISDNEIPFTTQARLKIAPLNISTEVSGHIEKVLVKEGEQVTVGQPLFELDSSQYSLAVDKAQANVLLAQSQWQQADRYLARIQSLYQSASASKEQLDEATANKQTKAATLQAAKADLKTAQRNLQLTQIVATKAGTVTNLTYQEGMYVTPSDTLVHIVNRQDLWIAADFTEKGLPALIKGRAVNIVFDAYPNQVFLGHIRSVDPAISTGAEQVTSLAQVEEETRWIRPQQKIRVRIQTDQAPTLLVAGSRASVMVRDDYHVADIWMTILSWMRYIY